tara:strand:- start:54 stop:524 length:471 start_codon:yes stop_codon:yes gene_type:complete
MRVGLGYDVHQFEKGDHVTLGGVVIPFNRGLKAHSDGDVVIHSAIDAILGAAALGDIGMHFPDTDPRYEKMDSRILLQETEKLIRGDYVVVNLDITLIAESPKIKDYSREMVVRIASDLCIEPGDVNIKATTSEKMGFVGRGEGIAANSICLLHSI